MTGKGPRRGQAKGKGAVRSSPQRRPQAGAAPTRGPATAEQLVEVFLRARPQRCAHWNVLTSEVFELEGRADAEARLEAFELRLFEEEGWVEVPWPESAEEFSIAEAFVEELEDGRERDELAAALTSAKPFRAFREALRRWPVSGGAWHERQREAAAWRLAEVAVAFDVAFDDARLAGMVAALRAAEGDEPVEGDAALTMATSARVPVEALRLQRRAQS